LGFDRPSSIAQQYALSSASSIKIRAQMALRYLPVRYEDMVEDMSGSVRRMLDFIGESFDELRQFPGQSTPAAHP
jgi:hypothetical protein